MAGTCEPGLPPCPQELCDEAGATCEECLAASACDDGDPCTLDDCVLGTCEHTPHPACDVLDAAVDEDQDGVPDSADACPSTAFATLVDADGCSCDQLDGDGDGISNCEDWCPDTSSEERVGGDGCTLPADNVEDIHVPSEVSVGDEIVGAPVGWPEAEEGDGNIEGTDAPAEASTEQEADLDAFATGAPNVCGSVACIPIVFMVGFLVAARRSSGSRKAGVP